jgi:hypothetical protein
MRKKVIHPTTIEGKMRNLDWPPKAPKIFLEIL